jgi:alanine-glyoxylate transaminase/serine-glyoxylate transaminase/serine-pyruvate transaminase
MAVHSGRHFLQIPGPTNVPDRVLRAMAMPTIDHRGPEFIELGFEVLKACQSIFRTTQPVIIYPSSGTGAWEAAITNALSPGDRVMMIETGQFALQWRKLAERFKLDVDWVEGDWRHGASETAIGERLARDKQYRIKAVMVVHNETSTGCVSDIPAIRRVIDDAGHPALLMVDTISGLGTMPYEHDGWGVDVTVAGSQKGLMLPPGLGFNAVSSKALAASKASASVKSYWDWSDIIAANELGSWPYTPATNLLYALKEAIAMLHEEGLANVFARHRRHGAAARAALRQWGLENVCMNDTECSPALTAVLLPRGHDADQFRDVVLQRFDMSLGTGLGKLKGRAFRIGHLGHFNDLMLIGTLGGVEMGLRLAGVPHRRDGVDAAMSVLTGNDRMADAPRAGARA